MTYVVVWRNEALHQLRSLRASDSAAAKTVIGAVSALAANPYPAASNRLGNSRFWRLRLGVLRVTYEVDEVLLAVHVYNIRPLSPPGRR
jgi:mRNA-degrading endonuclease RelE of RelBE toxin-antitoxin system